MVPSTTTSTHVVQKLNVNVEEKKLKNKKDQKK